MAAIKEKFEIFNDLSEEDLQKATNSSYIEDVFCALVFVESRITMLVHEGIGQTNKSFSAKLELKKFKMLEEMLKKRYKFLQRRLQAKKDKNAKIKRQKSEIHKLVDTGILSALVKENQQQKIKLERLELETRVGNRLETDVKAQELATRLREICDLYGVDMAEAIRINARDSKKMTYTAPRDLISENQHQKQDQDLNELTRPSVDGLNFDVLNEPGFTENNPIHLAEEPKKEEREE